MRRLLRRRSMTLATLAIGMAIAFPFGVLASHQFSDVSDANPFHDDIEALADSGVTLGCGGGEYCPTEYVTREQMAAFLNRLGALQAGKTPVVNAARVDGKDDVLEAGIIGIQEVGTWFASGSDEVRIERFIGGPSFQRDNAGTATVFTPLQAPTFIGDQSYSFDTLQLCFAGSSNVTITATKVTWNNNSGSSQVIAQDTTDRVGGALACYVVENLDPLPLQGAPVLSLDLSWSDFGALGVKPLSVGWEPVD